LVDARVGVEIDHGSPAGDALSDVADRAIADVEYEGVSRRRFFR